MLKLGFLTAVSFSLTLALAAPGCSDVENAYNCDQICDRYRDCFDANYDTDACQARCERNADDDRFAERASDCETCLDDRSCSGSFACVGECVGIVP